MKTVSLVVSTCNQPMRLNGLLCALAVQTYDRNSIEVWVADNSTADTARAQNVQLAMDFGAMYMHVGAEECYTAAEAVAPRCTGKWLGFPSDDCYYMPTYVETLVKDAELACADVAYCDCVYDARYQGHYGVMVCEPRVGAIDKGGFIMRRELFRGFPAKAPVSFSDGLMIEELVKEQRKFIKAPGVLWVHN